MTSPTFDRMEAILFGRLIATADTMYAPGVTNPHVPADLSKSWEVLKNMTVEATLDFIKQTEFIGFVARSKVDPTHVVTVLHGSRSILDFIDDFEFERTAFPYLSNGGETEYGFTQLYASLRFADPPSTEPPPPDATAELSTEPPSTNATAELSSGPLYDIRTAASDVTQSRIEQSQSVDLKDFLADPVVTSAARVTVVGHSLGGALAILHGAALGGVGVPVDVHTFGAPMVGDEHFVQAYGAAVRKSSAIVNKPDIVPKLPGTLLGYAQNGEVDEVNSIDFPELRRTIGCFHDLSTYRYVLGDTTVDISRCKA